MASVLLKHMLVSRSSQGSCGLALATLLCVLAPPAAHAQADRERQQMMQLQQQMQKLRQENAQLQQAKTQEVEKAEKLRDEAARVKREAGQLRALGSVSQRESKRLSEELSKAQEALQQSQTEAGKLKAELAQRDAALQVTAQQLASEKRSAENTASVLGARLKAGTARADLCEAKHESAMALGKDVIDRYESRQLRACEPFTGLWRLREEEQIQALRDRLFEARLDVPAASANASVK